MGSRRQSVIKTTAVRRRSSLRHTARKVSCCVIITDQILKLPPYTLVRPLPGSTSTQLLGITEHLLQLHQAVFPTRFFVVIRQIFTGDLSAVMAVNVFDCVDVTLRRSVLWLETVRSNTRQKRTTRMRSNPSTAASNPMACACGFAPMTSRTRLPNTPLSFDVSPAVKMSCTKH